MAVASTVTPIRCVVFCVTAWIFRTCPPSAQTVSTAVVPLTATAILRQRAWRIVSSPAYRAAVTDRSRMSRSSGSSVITSASGVPPNSALLMTMPMARTPESCLSWWR